MQVHEMMTQAVKSIGTEATVQEAADVMGSFNIGALPVCQDNHLVGMVTDRDILLRCVRLGRVPSSMSVVEVMTRDAIAIEPDRPIEEAAQKLGEHGFRRLPVVENGRLVGILSADDIARTSSDRIIADMARQIASQVHATV